MCACVLYSIRKEVMNMKKLVLSCPECESSNVLTTSLFRVCRRCGYKTEKKEEFKKNEDKRKS